MHRRCRTPHNNDNDIKVKIDRQATIKLYIHWPNGKIFLERRIKLRKLTVEKLPEWDTEDDTIGTCIDVTRASGIFPKINPRNNIIFPLPKSVEVNELIGIYIVVIIMILLSSVCICLLKKKYLYQKSQVLRNRTGRCFS